VAPSPSVPTPAALAPPPGATGTPSTERDGDHVGDGDDEGGGDRTGDGGWSSSSWTGEESPFAPSPLAGGAVGGQHARGNDLLDRFAVMCKSSTTGTSGIRIRRFLPPSFTYFA
jgi:hypothetical protein